MGKVQSSGRTKQHLLLLG